jgi:MFS family permease
MSSTDSTLPPASIQKPQPSPSRLSLAGLDWTNFFLADVRTGVGPFVAVYLAGLHWSVQAVGFALTVAEVAGVLTQAPGGALMDRVHAKRATLIAATGVLAASSILLAEFPTRWLVTIAQAALGVTGSIFVPGIGAITLGLVGYACLGARTGRNVGFSSAGNVIAAITMAVIGFRYSTRAIFFFVALLSVPATLAVLMIRSNEIDYDLARGAVLQKSKSGGLREIFWDRRMIILAAVTIFFHLGNGAMLPFAGQMVSATRPERADLWMGTLLMVPQVIMALICPAVGRIADAHGRKPILLFGLMFLPLRAVLFAFVRNPQWLVSAQILDGIAAGITMVAGTLIVADCTEGTGHFNLAIGAMGAAIGIGASISTAMAGVITQHWGYRAGFLSLAISGLIAVIIFWLMMPETKGQGRSQSVPATENIPRAA